MNNQRRMIMHISMVLCFAVCTVPVVNAQADANASVANGKEIKLNFRGVPLDTVLDYLSKEAGFVIVKEVSLSGTVDVWSHQPLNMDEAVNLINTVLHEKGYAAIRNERTLIIVNRDDAKKRNLPVKTGSNPSDIPRTDDMVTQIIPVRYVEAVQLIEDLAPLIPEYSTITANESSNAIVLTDTQSNIRRMVEIIKALDTSISGISAVKVFSIYHSDATELVDVVTKLFQVEDTSSANRGRNNFMERFRGPGGDRGGGSTNNEENLARKAVSRVVAVADEHTNSLIVSAPDELMPTITILIKEIDQSVEDLSEIRVFHLENADATELSALITELFPDDSSTQQSAPQFGRGGFFGGPQRTGGNTAQTDSSERKLQQTTVRAVADPRTDSIIVTAARETMIQIAQMVAQLDQNPKKRQKVFVYPLEYADVDNVAEILRSIFETNNLNTTNRTTTNQNANTLGNRTLNTTAQTGTNRFN
jgi:type II secretory pathway component GspD/PulD (secretin)